MRRLIVIAVAAGAAALPAQAAGSCPKGYICDPAPRPPAKCHHKTGAKGLAFQLEKVFPPRAPRGDKIIG
jgi:hypothetical protein